MTGLNSRGEQYEKGKSQRIPAWYKELFKKYPPPEKEKKKKKEGAEEEEEEEEEEERRKRKEEEEEEVKKNLYLHKNTMSHILRNTDIDSEKEKESFRKLLCYFLICFYVDVTSEDIGALHHLAAVDDL
ncbi:Restriction of telomere capping protein 1 [Bienertia sinuspersici]